MRKEREKAHGQHAADAAENRKSLRSTLLEPFAQDECAVLLAAAPGVPTLGRYDALADCCAFHNATERGVTVWKKRLERAGAAARTPIARTCSHDTPRALIARAVALPSTLH